MSNRHSKKQLLISYDNQKMRTELNDRFMENEKDKEKYFHYTTVNNKDYLQFPNIEAYNKNGYTNKRYHLRNRTNSNLYKDKKRLKMFQHIKNQSIDKTKRNLMTFNEINYTNTNTNKNKDKKFTSDSVNNKYYKTLNNKILLDEVKDSNSNLVLSSIKTPRINLSNMNNIDSICNINNIYDKSDYLKFFSRQSHKNNKARSLIIIKNLKNNRTEKSMNDNENSIAKLLLKKSSLNFDPNISNIYKNKKPKHRNEFKDFLQEILKNYRKKNKKKVKKKISTSYLMSFQPTKDMIKNKLDIDKISINRIDYDFNNRNNYKLNRSKKKIEIIPEEIKIKRKANYYSIYRFKKNKELINDIENKFNNLENKIKDNLNKFREEVNNEIFIFFQKKFFK